MTAAMVLWILLAAITAAVLAVLLRPLLRPPAVHERAADVDSGMAVYRDQLAELESERRRGLIPEGEAEAARAEIARRLLAGAEKDQGPAFKCNETSGWATGAALALAFATPLAAIALYVLLGSPGVPGYPLAARMTAPPEQADMGELVARVEARLREHPQDGQGWDAIAPVYVRQQRYREAADAFSRATALLGESPRRLAGFAEATVLANNGIVTEPARLAYAKLAKLEPQRIEPRFWLALADEQDGKLAEAAAAYEAILREGDEKAPWRQPIAAQLASVRARMAAQTRPQVKPDATPGPSAEDVAAAERLPAAERAAFIDRMVEGLAARLGKNGDDLAGWQRLIKAYAVLGRAREAAAALTDARRNFADQPQSLEQLDAVAKSLGLGS
jgi:cytochrome c-type biogenesis protein CcmH